MVSSRTLAGASPGEVEPDDAARYAAALTSRHSEPMRPVCAGYTPHAKQRVAHALADQTSTDVLCVNAGRRSGKSEWAAAQHLVRYVRDLWDKRMGLGRWAWRGPSGPWSPSGRAPEPFLHYALVAPTYSLLDPLRRKFQRMLGLYERGGWIVHQTGQTWWLLGGIRIDWRSGDRPDRLVAENYDGCGIDEFARCKGAIWEDHLQPALADSGGWATLTSTPLGKASAFYRVWALGDAAAAAEVAQSTGDEMRTDPHVRCIQWTSMENTANPRVAEYAERMRSRMPAPMWRRNFLASWVAFLGQVFELQDSRLRRSGEAEHLRRMHHVTAGMDFGFTAPGVFSVWGLDGDGGAHELRSHIARRLERDSDDAWRRRNNRDRTSWTNVAYELCGWVSEAAPQCRLRWNTVPIYVPHDDPGLKRAMRARGFNVRDGYVSAGSRLDGLQWFLSQAMDPSTLTFATPAVLRSFQSLVYPDGRSGAQAELWDKGRSDDHGFDASRMACSQRIKGWHLTPGASAINWHGR